MSISEDINTAINLILGREIKFIKQEDNILVAIWNEEMDEGRPLLTIEKEILLNLQAMIEDVLENIENKKKVVM